MSLGTGIYNIGARQQEASACEQPERWFRRSRSTGARARLFAFPYAGGSARAFRAWGSWFAPDLDFVAIDLPGRGAQVACALIDHMGPMVERLVTALEPLLDLPFAFFGHSMGALIAFELCHALRKLGRRTPEHLFVSAVRPPHLFPIEDPVHVLPDKQFIARLQQLDGIPAQTFESQGLLEMYLPILRADLRLAESYCYQPGPPLSHPITVFGGVDDPTTSNSSLQDWALHSRDACTVRLLAGGHFFINHQAHLMAASMLSSLSYSTALAESTSVFDQLGTVKV